jgi:hypothetical protein
MPNMSKKPKNGSGAWTTLIALGTFLGAAIASGAPVAPSEDLSHVTPGLYPAETAEEPVNDVGGSKKSAIAPGLACVIVNGENSCHFFPAGEQNCLEVGHWAAEIEYVSGTGVYSASVDCGTETIARTEKVSQPGDSEIAHGSSVDGTMSCYIDVWVEGDAELKAGCYDPVNPEVPRVPVTGIRWGSPGLNDIKVGFDPSSETMRLSVAALGA